MAARAIGLKSCFFCLSDEYVPTIKGVRTMDMIGQRLFTGRVAVAQAALTFTRKLFANTKAYSDGKRCTMRGEERNALSDVPQVSFYLNNSRTYGQLY